MKWLLLPVMALGFSGSAFSNHCSQGIGQAGFSSGFNSQSAVLDILWNTHGECVNHEDFLEAVDVGFGSDSDSEFIRCRAEGMQTALLNKMLKVSDECSWDAGKAGAETGAAVAEQFCEVSCEIGMAPVAEGRVYPQIFKQSCNSAFAGYVNRYCPNKRFHPKYNSVKSLTCQL